MKNFKSFTAIILAAAIVLSFAACTAKPVSEGTSGDASSAETVTVVVTDESGETVTDAEGNTVTEVVTVGDKASANLSEAESKADAEEESAAKEKADNKEKTTKKEETTKKAETTTQHATKPKNPNTVSEIKVSNITDSGLTLSWDGVSCDYYELEYKREDAEKWEVIDDKLNATSIDLSGLTSLTKYSFRLRSIIKHKAGNSESAWTYAEAKTKEQVIRRKIKIQVTLPTKNNEADKLSLYIEEGKKDRVKLTTADVKLDGSTFTFETEDKYEGLVTIYAKLNKADAVRKVQCDKEVCKIDISEIGIDTVYGEDDE